MPWCAKRWRKSFLLHHKERRVLRTASGRPDTFQRGRQWQITSAVPRARILLWCGTWKSGPMLPPQDFLVPPPSSLCPPSLSPLPLQPSISPCRLSCRRHSPLPPLGSLVLMPFCSPPLALPFLQLIPRVPALSLVSALLRPPPSTPLLDTLSPVPHPPFLVSLPRSSP